MYGVCVIRFIFVTGSAKTCRILSLSDNIDNYSFRIIINVIRSVTKIQPVETRPQWKSCVRSSTSGCWSKSVNVITYVVILINYLRTSTLNLDCGLMINSIWSN